MPIQMILESTNNPIIYISIRHEYEKHGTCFSGSNIDFFFSTVIALAQKYNVYDALAASGIYPNEDTPITMTQVVNAMQSYLNNTNADIHMSCIKEGIIT